jgi:biopolymer transport protein ExbD
MQVTTGFEDRRARIEIVPLIDVVFLLLVFFVYVMLSMVMYRGVRVNLPSAAGVTENLRTIIIAVSAENEISIDGDVVDIREAVVRAAERVKEVDYPVLISGDKAADLGVAIELLSALRGAGISSVSFQVRNDAVE